ncbi:MAG TPA: protein kinase, partial [Candidatus Tectomicrobia bacterium]
EAALTVPEHTFVEDPSGAQQGDLLPGHFTVVRRLGQGACAVALLVERDGQEYVLKVASTPEHNQRLQDEGEVLQQCRHPHIVEYCGLLAMGDRLCVLMRRAGEETLGQRLRKEGRLHVDLLQRFGDDLLSVITYLEDAGIAHRDIKPDNIGVGPMGRSDRLHLVLFAFSLARTPPDNIRAGTAGYIEPVTPPPQPWHILAQQLMALALQEQGIGRQDWFRWVSHVPGLARLPMAQVDSLVQWMLQQQILWDGQGMLWFGRAGEETYGRRNFLALCSVFTAPPLFTVLHGRDELGFTLLMTMPF